MQFATYCRVGLLALVALHCGARTEVSIASSGDPLMDDPGSPAATGDGGARDGGPVVDAAEDPCATPSGYAVCGGPNNCFPDAGGICEHCSLDEIRQFPSNTYSLGLCVNERAPDPVPLGLCDDNCVYVESYLPHQWNPFPFEVGGLFARNGAGDRVRYADMGTWTGALLPGVENCSPASGVPTCGAQCSPCAQDRICSGRSPTHPVGICVSRVGCARTNAWTCPQGTACFVFQVEPDAQAEADLYGSCLPVDECRAATGIPGGGVCHE